MQLSLLKGNVIYTCVLPEKKKGQYWITQVNEEGVEERVIGVEGIEDHWKLKSNRKAAILENGRSVKEVVLEPRKTYSIKLNRTNEEALLLTEPNSNDRKLYKKLILPPEGKITIGRNDECDIKYYSPFTSSLHAEILISGNKLILQDYNSSNGTFVNGKRVTNQGLHPGDVVYILGLKLIIGKNYIAINNPNNLVSFNDSIFIEYEKPKPIAINEEDEDEDLDDELKNPNVFFRSPRFKRDIERKELKLDAPPSLGNMEQTPLMLMLGPSITMGMASLFTGIITVSNTLNNNGKLMNAMPTLVMSVSMLLGMILWPILTRRYEGKKKLEQEKLRQEKYRAYLEDIRKEIAAEREHQRKILHENIVPLDDCIERIQNRKRNLWERTHLQNDFIKIRLGLGTLPLALDLKYPEKRFSLEDDELKVELERLVEEPRDLEQVPISLSLTEDWVTGMIGNRDDVIKLVKSLIFQLTALHSYDEVKLVFLYNDKEQEVWNFVKWLPHVWDNQRSVRFIATDANEVREISAFLEREILAREQIQNDEDLKEVTPYYLIFALDKNLAAKAEMINLVLKHKSNHGFSVVHLYDELRQLPKECSLVVQHDGSDAKIYDKDDISGNYISFQSDHYANIDEEDLVKRLANIQLDSALSKFTLPTMLTFLDMFEVGKIEHLNALTRWKENDPTRTLQTPIGVDTTGEKFHLDLHEKFHGPHGLIAGMTGSGKSEVIMTYILSLAVNYHPHEVAFILIDYKGGGMANAFTELPHLAGTITNLDGTAVKRSLISIQSELKRRQSIFGEASKKLNVSNIDIYKYQKLFREGQVSQPLQHLFIISDEFAELKTQQPEFMEQLVSAARIGRSLGVHLILATQKPSGVVDDQIWSNSKFRICLKVQEKADSMDVIKRPDAAELSVTGRFFVQVGYNELFELGQSAWGGAPYYPSERVEKKQDDSVVIIDQQGRPLKEVKPSRQMMIKSPAKQIDEINKYLAGIAKEENIRVRPLWLDPIPQCIYLKELREKYPMSQKDRFEINPVIGEMDDPSNQRQLVLTFPLSKEGNAVIYGSAASGKSTFLRTLIYSLLEDHSAEELNLYLLDFGSETLRAFAKAPHVGDVLLSHETEKINNLFKLLYQEVEQRKKQFSDYGGDYYSYRKATNARLANIVVVINNISAFTEMFEDREEALSYLTREGLKYGIYFILTAANTGAVRYRLLQNFKQLFVLQLNDPTDYTSVLGNVDGVYPSKLKGRGILKTDLVYEFQTALISQDLDNIFDYIRRYCDDLAQNSAIFAKRVPILPEKVDTEFLINEIKNSSAGRVPVGVEKNSLQVSYYEYERSYINLVLSQNNERADFTQGLAEVLVKKGDSTVTVFDPEEKFLFDPAKEYSYYGKQANFDDVIAELFYLLVTRNNSYKDALAAGEPAPHFDKQIYVFASLASLQIRLSEDSKDKLKLLLEKGDSTYNVHFFICDSASYLSTVNFEPWFRNHVSLKDGIWIGNGISNQYQFKLDRITNDMYQEIGDDFGYFVKNGKTTLIKLATSTKSSVEVMV
jgi:DNA segregation ATPase FtsK/SpoIIIE, S-DNA-T family